MSEQGCTNHWKLSQCHCAEYIYIYIFLVLSIYLSLFSKAPCWILPLPLRHTRSLKTHIKISDNKWNSQQPNKIKAKNPQPLVESRGVDSVIRSQFLRDLLFHVCLVDKRSVAYIWRGTIKSSRKTYSGTVRLPLPNIRINEMRNHAAIIGVGHVRNFQHIHANIRYCFRYFNTFSESLITWVEW